MWTTCRWQRQLRTAQPTSPLYSTQRSGVMYKGKTLALLATVTELWGNSEFLTQASGEWEIDQEGTNV